MKVLYSQIKELVPELKVSPKEVANILTIIGFMADAFEKVTYQGKKDYLIGLEVRQNRGDGQSVIGIAKEVAAYYGLEIKIPFLKENIFKKGATPSFKIKVEAPSIKRILTFKISGLENKKSPLWLVDFLDFYEIKSINFLVDLSNYVMILTGFPSHLLDFDKINGILSWTLNSFNEIKTLSDSCLKLKGGELIIRDDKNILALAGVIGGEAARIDSLTKTIIAEMAVYNDAVIRKDSRSLNTVTEASNRLSKKLDPNGLDFAANYLVHLVLENFDNALLSETFEYYPDRYIPKKIIFDPKMPAVLAGVEISKGKSITILKNLGFKIINDKDDKIEVVVPLNRTDISIPDDLAVEVVRIFGYDKIPVDEIPSFEIATDITPKKIYLFEKIRDILSNLGIDEVLSLPLVQEKNNSKVNYSDLKEVATENSVNENYPKLKQSLATGLIDQFNQYQKKNVKSSGIFEIGKVYGTIDKIKKDFSYEDYIENDNLGILISCKNLSGAKEIIEKTLRQIGLTNIFYQKSKKVPQIANFYSCWDFSVKKENRGNELIGIFYKLNPEFNNLYFGEFNINKIVEILEKTDNKPVTELIQKLIILDVNIELDKTEAVNVNDFIFKIKKKIGEDNLWDINIVDQFLLEKKIRYTLRISYKNLSDQEAKKLHFKLFKINKL